MEKIGVALLGLGLIAFIVWWFFVNHHKVSEKSVIRGKVQEIEIEVNGGYSPETIILKKGLPAKLTFYRKDPSSCLDQIVLADFGIHKDLPLKEKTLVTIHPDKEGEYGFACGMNMFKGKLIVE
ncbi:cupredoxin domain-containing protein [Streptococcus didelphis]|uniref:Cupredoxin domain-containing protein n=1 Tax=Streptococcus didelphis TaxID=102886 RepID=A0ABY9LIM3_9STRE|nr:cupredoxin domain-containing protein [Streptococcus didelphis]WMB28741.1 cupredoxin domain-containing protein [Streptococcus didelphis]WMB29400.1 cupredoxin domain-containing protein [Streptococcus didelphis]